MLTKDEKDYLAKIPASKKVSVKPFNLQAKRVGDSIVSKIKKALPDPEVLFMGATALGVAGQNDVDIYVLSKPKDFNKYLPTLKKLFGEPQHIHKIFVEWKFKENGYPVELYLTEPPERQIKVFEILKSDKELLKEYENLKLGFDRKSFRDYQRAKYEFYNEILSANLVRRGYDRIAKKYNLARNQFKNLKYLEKLNLLLNPASTVLDLGCGAGEPIDKFLVDHGHQIIGIDISSKQIDLARKNVPQGKFEVKDLSELKEKEFNVDAVISFYTIFHIPRKKHQELFRTINSFLPEGGLLLVTMGASKWEGVEDFHGTQMYWSHYGPEKNRKMLENAGFRIILDKIDRSGGEKHQVILAAKISREIDWEKVMKQFKKEMSDKLKGLPGHQEVPESLREFRSIISHELPETSPKGLYRRLIKLLLKNKLINADNTREKYLNPELEREQQIISSKKEEFKKLKQDAWSWVKRNLPEKKLQELWKDHKTWLPRRYTIYKNPDLPFQKIAADTLARYYLIKEIGK